MSRIAKFFAKLFSPNCPYGGHDAATCYGCWLDSQWIGSAVEEHFPTREISAPVPQATRSACADHYERTDPMGFGFVACAIRDGRRDDDPRVQAFASLPRDQRKSV